MRSQTLGFGIAAFVAGAVLGVAGSRFAGVGPPPAAHAPPTSTVPSTAAVTAPPPADQGATPLPNSAPAGAGPSTAPASAPPGSGKGVITGRATDSDGKPLAGVLVRAWAVTGDSEDDPLYAPDPPDGSPPPLPDIERATEHLRARLLREQAGLREAVTDATGAYALRGLTAPGYVVRAWLAGHRLERTTREESGDLVAVGGTRDFRSTLVGTVRFSVLLPDGTPAKEANITWAAPGGAGEGGGWDWTPASPTISVDHGTWEFTATAALERLGGPLPVVREWWSGSERFLPHDGEPPYRSEPKTATVGGDAPTTIVLRLRGRPGIRVVVDFASPERPRSFRIAAVRTDDPGGAAPERLLEREGPASRWISEGAEGVLTGLEPGEHLVGVTFHGGLLGPTAVVSVANDVATQELRVSGEIRDWIKVRVLAPDGSAVTDPDLSVGCRGTEGGGSADCHEQALPDGSFRVEHFEWGAPSRSSSFSGDRFGDGPRTWWVRAESERFGVAEATYDRAHDREVTLAFSAPAVLRVAIGGFDKSPDSGRVSVRLEDADEDEDTNVYHHGEIDRTGTAVFPAVTPGRYVVVMELGGEGKGPGRRRRFSDDAEVARVAVTLGPGETTLPLTLPAVSYLTVTFEGEPPNIERLDGSGERQDAGVREPGDDGRSVGFADLPAGRYRLYGDSGAMWVEVPAAQTIAFRPTPYDACRLHVEGKGYMQELGLRTGDLLVAVDGAEFKDAIGIEAALATAKTRESSTFTFLRDGQRFDAAVDGRRFEESDGAWHTLWSR